VITKAQADIEQCPLWTVEEIAVVGVTLVELVTGLGVRIEPGTLGGGEQAGGQQVEEEEEFDSSQPAERERTHLVSHPLTARVSLSLRWV